MTTELTGTSVLGSHVDEVLSCAYEWIRTNTQQCTNWPRYIANCKLMVIVAVAEYRGDLVDIAASSKHFGYDVDQLLEVLYGGTRFHEEMSRQYKSYLLFTAEKSGQAGKSRRGDSELFDRYAPLLARDARTYFRLRDADSLMRYAMASTLACNDCDEEWFTDEQMELLCELGAVFYDAATYPKHVAEGETHNAFAYAIGPEDDDSVYRFRATAFKTCREVLWQLDAVWAPQSFGRRALLNCLRSLGGWLHTAMRRYRYVEDNMTLGNPLPVSAVVESREGYKLWNRVDQVGASGGTSGEKGATKEWSQKARERYADVIRRKDELLPGGFAEMLESSEEGRCAECLYPEKYGAGAAGEFGGVKLCDGCRAEWRAWIESFPERAARLFPEIAR